MRNGGNGDGANIGNGAQLMTSESLSHQSHPKGTCHSKSDQKALSQTKIIYIKIFFFFDSKTMKFSAILTASTYASVALAGCHSVDSIPSTVAEGTRTSEASEPAKTFGKSVPLV